MEYLILSAIVIGLSVQNISNKAFNEKCGNSPFTYSSLCALCAALFFVFTSGMKFSFTPDILVYSLLFGITYALAIAATFIAIATGPLSLSTLIISYSLIIPTFYGIFFLDESVDATLIIGLVFLAISLFLVNYEKKTQEKHISAKWLLFVLIAFLSNGCCTLVQKIHQIKFDGAYKSEFMIIALLCAVMILIIPALILERKNIKTSIKKGGIWIALYGIFNGLCNFLVMLLAAKMSASVMYPLISAGGIILSYIVARFVYKEKLAPQQNIGVICGIIAVILLNL